MLNVISDSGGALPSNVDLEPGYRVVSSSSLVVFAASECSHAADEK